MWCIVLLTNLCTRQNKIAKWKNKKKQNLLPPMVVGQHALYSYIENGKSDERRRYCMFRKHAFSPSQGGVWSPPPCEGEDACS